MRLIDADELKKESVINKGDFNSVESIRKWIDSQPTVEAESVRHGYWIYTPADTDTTTKARFKCSECGRMRNMFVRYQHKYCAECGAKMDGGKK